MTTAEIAGTARCPCGTELTKAAELAHRVCTYCRVDAKKKPPPRRRYKPDFVDVPIPGLGDWGAGMTTTEIAPVIDAEIVDTSAERLDKRLRLLVGSISDSITKLYDLLEEAKHGEIHTALGFSSWTAYVADVFTVPVRLEREQRRELVGYLSGEGMSQRAIADVVGADQATVSRDLARDANASPEPTTGLDGKTYPQKQKPKEPKPVPEPEPVVVEPVPLDEDDDEDTPPDIPEPPDAVQVEEWERTEDGTWERFVIARVWGGRPAIGPRSYTVLVAGFQFASGEWRRWGISIDDCPVCPSPEVARAFAQDLLEAADELEARTR